MFRSWLLLAVISLSASVLAQENTLDIEQSSNHYIRDDLFVFLHAGAGRNYRILGSVEAGTPITVLQHNREQEFTEIRDNEGRRGWVETKFVSDEISRGELVPVLTERLAQAQSGTQGLQSDNQRLNQQLNEARQQVSKLSAQVTTQEREIKQLSQQVDESEQKELVRWFTRGGIVAGAGIILGVVLTYLPKKKRRDDQWM
ncbi:TIGR04211 family SH3 domain-containing protein [Alteromonas sp. ASW11-130]|uniref:TIGR04211 family SH3 domain-containing protein n=1 Tax=Alteromonas sp. ASW11-130 TaxID=3015775 RepID=UPI002242ACE5|nr:TIGR04211 family SH3 domain-containing protein [Alteromonas sp. ASW11-130]MCW8091878.1 TIGR04211 family SH3 domain-containing protein [Alteromonas sp. ASW11-130]